MIDYFVSALCHDEEITKNEIAAFLLSLYFCIAFFISSFSTILFLFLFSNLLTNRVF